VGREGSYNLPIIASTNPTHRSTHPSTLDSPPCKEWRSQIHSPAPQHTSPGCSIDHCGFSLDTPRFQ
jgi:hypothetical protein